MDLLTALRGLPWPWRGRWRIGATVPSVHDVPELLPRRRAVLVGSAARPKWLVFDCPCGAGHRVMVTLDPDSWPRWHVDKLNPLTLRPSVDETHPVGHCHYVIHGGRIRWV